MYNLPVSFFFYFLSLYFLFFIYIFLYLSTLYLLIHISIKKETICVEKYYLVTSLKMTSKSSNKHIYKKKCVIKQDVLLSPERTQRELLTNLF